MGKEMWRWDHTIAETNPHDPKIKGMRPIGFQEYPSAMYKPMRDPKGVLCFEFQEARDENHRATLEDQGYVWGGKEYAMKVLDARELEIAKLAANRNYQELHMGEKARAEAEVVENATDELVPVIPPTPIKPRK